MSTLVECVPNFSEGRRLEVVDAIAAMYGWTQESGVTKQAFAKQQVIAWMKDVVKRHESETITINATNQMQQDQRTNDADVDGNVNIT